MAKVELDAWIDSFQSEQPQFDGPGSELFSGYYDNLATVKFVIGSTNGLLYSKLGGHMNITLPISILKTMIHPKGKIKKMNLSIEYEPVDLKEIEREEIKEKIDTVKSKLKASERELEELEKQLAELQ